MGDATLNPEMPLGSELGSELSVNPAAVDTVTNIPAETVQTQAPSWLRITMLIGAVIMMFLGQFQIFRDSPDALYSGGFLMIVLGVILVVAILGNGLVNEGYPIRILEATQIGKIRLRPFWLLATVVLIGFESWRGIFQPEQAYAGEYLLLSLMALFAFLMGILPAQAVKVNKSEDPHRIRLWEYNLLLALFIGAFAIRAVNLGTTPYLMDQDEAKFALEGAEMNLSHFLATPFSPGVDSHPRIYMLFISVSTALMGITLGAARFPSAILGALGVPAVYLLGREIFDRRVALVAALFMLPWAYQVEFSRISMNQPADPLFATLAFYFLLRGLRRSSVTDYFIAGVTLGLSQLFYLGGRLAPIAMVSFLVYASLRQPRVILKQWKLILIVPIAGLIVTFPHFYYLAYFKLPLSTRADKSVLVDGEIQDRLNEGGVPRLITFFKDQAEAAFGGFIAKGDGSGWYGYGSNLMGVIGGPLIILGVIASLLVLYRQPKWCIPLGWGICIVTVTSVLGQSPPFYERFYAGVSCYALLAALGAMTIGAAVAKVTQRPQLRNRVLLAFGVIMLLGNFAFLVWDYIPSKSYAQNRSNWKANLLTNVVVNNYDAGRQVILLGKYESGVENNLVLRFFMEQKKYVFTEDPFTTGSLRDQYDIHKPVAFIVAINRSSDLAVLQSLFPDGQTQEYYLEQDGSAGLYLFTSNGAPSNIG